MSARSLRVKSLPCLACRLYGVYKQPYPTQEHHLNLGGMAGQKRRGDDYSIPLCEWHHVGRKHTDIDLEAMTALYGPSLARQSKKFREVFGKDDDLLKLTDEQLEIAA